MREVLGKLFKSKKFVTMLATVVVYVASVWGIDVDPEKVYPLLMLVGAYIAGQSFVDARAASAKATIEAKVDVKTDTQDGAQ